MKITILSIICLIIIVLIIAGCSSYIGISKKKAALNLETYLDREYNGKLTFSHLKRFFNAATMDPNMFGVLVYDKDIPEIEFYTHINVKDILENDTLPMYPISDLMTFDDLYKGAVERYETRQAVITDFKNEIPEIKFSTETIDLNFKKEIRPIELEDVIIRFIDRLNQSFRELGSSFQFSLLIRTAKNPDGFMVIPLEVEDSKWKVKRMTLSEKVDDFEVLKTMIQKNIQTKLEIPYPDFSITNHGKI
jgi:hypothetical protein